MKQSSRFFRWRHSILWWCLLFLRAESVFYYLLSAVCLRIIHIKQESTFIDIPKWATRWSCCFAPKQTDISEFYNASLAIRILCYDFWGKVTNAIYNTNFCNFLEFWCTCFIDAWIIYWFGCQNKVFDKNYDILKLFKSCFTLNNGLSKIWLIS